MVVCPNCGADNAPGTNFCVKCGLDLRRSQYAQSPSQRMTHPFGKKRTPIAVIVAIVVVATIIIIAVIALVIINLQNHATLVVNVTSHQYGNTINYRLFIDGKLKENGSLNPGDSVQFTFSIPIWDNSSRTVNVYADSTGGGFGPTSDAQNVVLEKDTTNTVSLSI